MPPLLHSNSMQYCYSFTSRNTAKFPIPAQSNMGLPHLFQHHPSFDQPTMNWPTIQQQKKSLRIPLLRGVAHFLSYWHGQWSWDEDEEWSTPSLIPHSSYTVTVTSVSSEGNTRMKYIPTKKQLADIMTKSVKELIFFELCRLLCCQCKMTVYPPFPTECDYIKSSH